MNHGEQAIHDHVLATLIPPHRGPATRVPSGPPRVVWKEINGGLPDFWGAVPGAYLISVRQVHTRPSPDGQGDVFVIYQLDGSRGTGVLGTRDAEVATVSSHDAVLNGLIAQARDPDEAALLVHAYADGMKTERLGMVDDRVKP
jgi:hypothetical protein